MKIIGMLFLLILLPAISLIADDKDVAEIRCSIEHDIVDYGGYEEYLLRYNRCIELITEGARLDVIEGFKVYTSPAVIYTPGFTYEQLGVVMDAIQAYLYMLDKLLPTKAMNALRSSRPSIYLDNSESPSRKSRCSIPCYHYGLNEIVVSRASILPHGET